MPNGSLVKPVSHDITPSESLVDCGVRRALFQQEPITIWLTGLSGSGKSTVAKALEEELIGRGNACYILDGDNVRHGLNRDLGFSAADRTENIRRISEVSRLFNEAGLIVITAFISPYLVDRAAAREIIGDGRMLEVFIDAPLTVCEARDPKGLYRKARAGEIANFTGLTAPYEAPPAPEIHIPTEMLSPAEAVARIIGRLKQLGIFDQ